MTTTVRRRLPLWKKLTFTLIVVAGGPLLLEAGARLLHGWNRHWLDCHRPHPTLGWVLRENWSGKWSWTGGTSRINAQGLRMDDDLGPKQPGEKRLLVLGDSVTFGANVKTSESLPAQLQGRLTAALADWRVLNGGVTSYDPEQEREWLEEFGWPLQPDALLVVFCRNDVSPSQRQKSDVHRSSAGRLGQWLTERSLLAFKLERGLARLRAAALGREGQKSLVVAAAAELEGLPFVEQAYRQLAASARERGVPVTLLIVPTLDLLTGKEADDLSPRLTALGDELGWRVIDLEPALLPADPAWFLPDDPVHPSAAGYARLADWLAPRIQADLAAR